MAHATHSTIINRPIDDVFAYIADGTNDVHWRKDMLSSTLKSVAPGQDAIYKRVIHGPFGTWQRIRFDYQITNYHPPYELSYKHVKGAARPVGTFQLEKEGAGSTKVTFTLEWHPKSPLGRMIDEMLEEQLKADTANLEVLKKVLEK